MPIPKCCEYSYSLLCLNINEKRKKFFITLGPSLLSIIALFSTEDIKQDQLTVPLDFIRRHQYSFSLLVKEYKN